MSNSTNTCSRTLTTIRPSIVFDNIIDFIPSMNCMGVVFIVLRGSKKEALKESLLYYILEASLNRDRSLVTMNENNLKWLLDKNFLMSSLDVSAQDHFDNLLWPLAIEYLEKNLPSILHLRVHGRNTVFINDDIIQRIVTRPNTSDPRHQTLLLTGDHRFSSAGIKNLASMFHDRFFGLPMH